MKSLICIVTFLFLLSAQAQLNKEIITDDGRKFLLGKISLDGLKSKPYQSWFENGYENYTVDESLVDMIKKQLADYQIKLFLGTWCGDSKREVPRFIKILKAAGYPMENLEIVALDRRKEFYKTSPTGEEKGLHIIKVPTLIFLKDGKEVNRIVESPIESLEEDMATIVQGKEYIPNYASSR